MGKAEKREEEMKRERETKRRGGEKRKGEEEPGKDRFSALHSPYHYLKP